MNSLSRRLLAASLLGLLLFVLLTGFSLEQASVRNAELAEQDRLRGLVYGLLGAAEPQPGGGLSVAEGLLPEAELRQPGSGVEAVLWDSEGRPIWQSPSVIETPAAAPPAPAVGTFEFRRLGVGEGDAFRLLFGLSWLHEDGQARRYQLAVSQDVAPFEARHASFRTTLWAWLGGFTLILLAVQGLVLRWGLRPLRDLDAELAAIRRGEVERVEGRYPVELQPLGDGLNALLAHERSQQSRYRDALADLAHSLKTPLAVLRGLPHDADPEAERQRRLVEQVERMDQIVAYQLRRAAAAGSRIWHARQRLRPQLERIAAALAKVYRERSIDFQIEVAEDFGLPLEQGDLMELFGNLLDNASKHCRGRVRVSAGTDTGWTWVKVDDDGEGFPDRDPEQLLQRGVRQDSRHDGQGFGLALVHDIVSAAGGEVRLESSPWQGARVRVLLPR